MATCNRVYGLGPVDWKIFFQGNRVYIGVIWGLYGDNGKDNGNYYIILGLYIGCVMSDSSKQKRLTAASIWLTLPSSCRTFGGTGSSKL